MKIFYACYVINFLNNNQKLKKNCFITEAHPQPDFFAGLTSFLQKIAHELGELNT